MTDQESLALCAIRYTIGRMSYIVSDGQRWALEWGAKSPRVRKIIMRDLEWEIQREDEYFIPEGRGYSGLGQMQSDSLGWRQVYAELKKMENGNGQH